MRTLVQLLPSHTVFTAHSLRKAHQGGPPARGPGRQAPLLIRGAIYTILFKNCTGIMLLLPGPRRLQWVLSCVLSRATDLKCSCRQRGGLSACLWVFMAHPLVSRTYAPQCVWGVLTEGWKNEGVSF